jgi:poly(A) polymerase
MLNNAIKIIKKLQSKGFTAYIAGGYVRDKLIGIEAKDIDIATDAKPLDIIKLFTTIIPVGEAFGVIIVVIDNDHFEVATFRTDGEYIDGRRPVYVKYSSEYEDAKRRDFTINSMFYDPINDKIIDYFNGQQDLKNKILRTVGDPEDRFNEDHLRILRAVRFAIKYNLTIDLDVEVSIVRNVNKLKIISKERIRDEITKILQLENASAGLKMLKEYKILKSVLPLIDMYSAIDQDSEHHPEGNLFNHVIEMFKNNNYTTKAFVWSILLHDIGKLETKSVDDKGIIHFYKHEVTGLTNAKDILKQFKFSNIETKTILNLIKNHMKFFNVFNMKTSKLKKLLRNDDIELLLELHRLDVSYTKDYKYYDYCIEKLEEYKNNKEELKPKLLITGKDLITLSLTPSPYFKQILNKIEDLQLENKIKTKDEAIAYVQELITKSEI